MIESGDVDQAYLEDLARRDNLFSDIDPRDFTAR